MRPWRDRCEEALRAFTEPDALRFWHAATPLSGPLKPVFDYRYEHTIAVVRLARWLAPAVGADPLVVECAAWLHDCRKRLHEDKGPDNHAREASDAVPDILAGTDFPADRIPAVRQAIQTHVGLQRSHRLEPLEAACLWDCDKLSKLGAASILHHVCITGAFRPVTTGDLMERGLAWLELADGIAASMNTEPARIEALQRLAFQRGFYSQLQAEWTLPVPVQAP